MMGIRAGSGSKKCRPSLEKGNGTLRNALPSPACKEFQCCCCCTSKPNLEYHSCGDVLVISVTNATGNFFTLLRNEFPGKLA